MSCGFHVRALRSADQSGDSKPFDFCTEKLLAAGDAATLRKTPLYSFSISSKPSVYVNGTYYLYDATSKNGRRRVTDKVSKAGKKPALLFAVGWLDEKQLITERI